MCVCVRVCYLKQQVLCVFMECNMLTAVSTQRETPPCTSGLYDNTSIDIDIDVCAKFSAPYTFVRKHLLNECIFVS